MAALVSPPFLPLPTPPPPPPFPVAGPYTAIKAAGQIWVVGQILADTSGTWIEDHRRKDRHSCKNPHGHSEASGSEIKVVRVGVF